MEDNLKLFKELYIQNKESLLEEAESLQPENRMLDTGFFFKETVY